MQEINVHERLSPHEFIIPLRTSFEDAEGVYLMFELCRGGSIGQYLGAAAAVSERMVAVLFEQVVKAVVHSHAHGKHIQTAGYARRMLALDVTLQNGMQVFVTETLRAVMS